MSARVLVVDDIEVNVKLLEAKLLSEYYDVLTASNGPAALEIARRYSAPESINFLNGVLDAIARARLNA